MDVRVPIVTLLLLTFGRTMAAAQTAGDDEDRAWSVSARVAIYRLPDEGDYGQPTFTADRAALHLEARYNYEALRTTSLWAGYTLRGGDRVQWEITPMSGVVLGATKGLAPGYAASLNWWKIDAYSEGEYVFATTSADSFAYNWSEVAVAPLPMLRTGMVTQRTRAYASDRAIQRGPFVNATFGPIESAVYVFLSSSSKPVVVLSFGWSR